MDQAYTTDLRFGFFVETREDAELAVTALIEWAEIHGFTLEAEATAKASSAS